MRRWDSGMTLVELVVVLALTSIFLVSALTLMVASARSLAQGRTFGGSVTDEAVAARLLQWDLGMAGYGIPRSLYTTYPPIVLVDNVSARSDSLVLQGVNLGVDPHIGKWSLVLSSNPPASPNLVVLRWNHPFRDFSVGDTVLLTVAVAGRLVGASFSQAVISSLSPTTWTDPRTGQSWDAFNVGLDRAVQSIQGAVVYGSGDVLTAVYTLDAANNRLLRNGEVFMEGVYAFQAQVWVDENGNGRIDPGEWWDAVSAPNDIKNVRSIRVEILTLKGNLPGSRTRPASIPIGNTTVSLPSSSAQKFVDQIEIRVAPKNLTKEVRIEG